MSVQASSLNGAIGGNGKNNDDQLKNACQQLESFFWEQMLSAMDETIPEDGELGDSFASGVYQDMMNQQYALLLAQSNLSDGLTNVMYQQLGGKSQAAGATETSPEKGALQPGASPGKTPDGSEPA